MIPGHEKQTHELTPYEMEEILPKVVKRMKTKLGKENAVTNPQVVKAFKEHGFRLSEPRFRKIIQHIRVNGLINGLVSHGKGYFVATKKEDIKRNIESLDKKINSEIVTRDTLLYQMNIMFPGKEKVVDENPFE